MFIMYVWDVFDIYVYRRESWERHMSGSKKSENYIKTLDIGKESIRKYAAEAKKAKAILKMLTSDINQQYHCNNIISERVEPKDTRQVGHTKVIRDSDLTMKLFAIGDSASAHGHAQKFICKTVGATDIQTLKDKFDDMVSSKKSKTKEFKKNNAEVTIRECNEEGGEGRNFELVFILNDHSVAPIATVITNNNQVYVEGYENSVDGWYQYTYTDDHWGVQFSKKHHSSTMSLQVLTQMTFMPDVHARVHSFSTDSVHIILYTGGGGQNDLRRLVIYPRLYPVPQKIHNATCRSKVLAEFTSNLLDLRAASVLNDLILTQGTGSLDRDIVNMHIQDMEKPGTGDEVMKVCVSVGIEGCNTDSSKHYITDMESSILDTIKNKEYLDRDQIISVLQRLKAKGGGGVGQSSNILQEASRVLNKKNKDQNISYETNWEEDNVFMGARLSRETGPKSETEKYSRGGGEDSKYIVIQWKVQALTKTPHTMEHGREETQAFEMANAKLPSRILLVLKNPKNQNDQQVRILLSVVPDADKRIISYGSAQLESTSDLVTEVGDNLKDDKLNDADDDAAGADADADADSARIDEDDQLTHDKRIDEEGKVIEIEKFSTVASERKLGKQKAPFDPIKMDECQFLDLLMKGIYMAIVNVDRVSVRHFSGENMRVMWCDVYERNKKTGKKYWCTISSGGHSRTSKA